MRLDRSLVLSYKQSSILFSRQPCYSIVQEMENCALTKCEHLLHVGIRVLWQITEQSDRVVILCGMNSKYSVSWRRQTKNNTLISVGKLGV